VAGAVALSVGPVAAAKGSGVAAPVPACGLVTGELTVASELTGLTAPGMVPPLAATHRAKSAGGTTSTAIGMKPWRAPQSSEHWP
jgi:hypothetical protein